MTEKTALARSISVAMVRDALDIVTYHYGQTVEQPEPACSWPRLCAEDFCRFPRYQRGGQPVGLTGHTLIELGYPMSLLKELDTEYELGEVIHTGVKIGRSRNPALRRISAAGIALLAFCQNHQKVGWSWNDITLQAFRPRWMVRQLDKRRRPWLY